MFCDRSWLQTFQAEDVVLDRGLVIAGSKICDTEVDDFPRTGRNHTAQSNHIAKHSLPDLANVDRQ